ncbi:hypothetical protein GCM10009850_106230 [Nonomuraea monospora]|uniref:Uncharacterized protein n=1 Tax=Nonomuraea monospora TaxID=568818 RepID=A0ABN3D070_9ACTN
MVRAESGVDMPVWVSRMPTSPLWGSAAVRQNDVLIAASQRAAGVLGTETPAGARFGVAAEFLLLVNASLRQVMEQWQQRHRRDV